MVNFNEINLALKARSEQEAKTLLQNEGRRLKYIAVKIWRQYLASYQPEVYVRTRASQRGIKLGQVHKIGENEFGIELTFENKLMYYDDYFKTGSKGHSIMLISDGWNKSKRETKLSRKLGRQVYRLTYFEGIDYLAKVEAAFNAGKPLNVTLERQWSGVYIK